MACMGIAVVRDLGYPSVNMRRPALTNGVLAALLLIAASVGCGLEPLATATPNVDSTVGANVEATVEAVGRASAAPTPATPTAETVATEELLVPSDSSTATPTTALPSPEPRQIPPTPESSLTPPPEPPAPAPTQAIEDILVGNVPSRVIEVIDGDTIDVALGPGGAVERIRLLGIDTPETFSLNKANEYGDITDTGCLDRWGQSATEYVMDVLEGRVVDIVFDQGDPRRDVYGRVLAYVHVGGLDVNLELVRRGYARVYVEADSNRLSEYLPVERQAREARMGLWSCESTTADLKPTPTTMPEPTTMPMPTEVIACDLSYPDVCIPSFPPDLDCADVPYRRFRVIGRDPHSFDGNNDGIGCER